METTLKIFVYLALASSALVIFYKMGRRQKHLPVKNTRQKQDADSLRFISSGLLVLMLSVLVSFIFPLALFVTLLGAWLIFSGSMFLNSKSSSFLREIKIPLTLIFLSQFVFAGVYFKNLDFDSATGESSSDNSIKSQAVLGKRFVNTTSYAREGSSSSHEILGVVEAGNEVKVHKKENGFYYVSGSYKKGQQGEGRQASGKFWIGGSLLSQSKSDVRRSGKKPKRTYANKKQTKKAAKSWPSFD